MFDVYLNNGRDLLVVRRGWPIPLGGRSGRWRKSKKRVVMVSEEIRLAIQEARLLHAQTEGFEEELVFQAHGQPLQHDRPSRDRPRDRSRSRSMSMRCQDCSQLRGYPYKRSHLVAQDFGERSAIDVVDRGSDEAQTGDPHE